MQETRDNEDPFDTARELLQRTTSFLSSCVHANDAGLKDEDVKGLIDSLRELSAGSKQPAPASTAEPAGPRRVEGSEST